MRLKVSEFQAASPVVCAAGVTGAELKKWIEGIMMNRFARAMGLEKKLMLAAVAVAAVAGPLAFGIVSVRAQSAPQPSLEFEVASVRVQHGEPGGAGDEFPVDGTWRWKHIGISYLVAYAYGVSWKYVEGVPKELRAPDLGFDIVAKMPLKTSRQDFRLMLQSLLADRFKAAIHTEVRDVLVNTIEVAKGGVKLPPASGQCVEAGGNASLPADQHRCHEVVLRAGMSKDQTRTWEYSGRSISIADLATKLSNNDLIVDHTGLTGLYDLDVKIAEKTTVEGDEFDRKSNWNYAVKTGWEQQAGLSIDLSKTKRRPATVVVVDHVELPTPN
jgi:uncharacterized protein (TIGR03435 family)